MHRSVYFNIHIFLHDGRVLCYPAGSPLITLSISYICLSVPYLAINGVFCGLNLKNSMCIVFGKTLYGIFNVLFQPFKPASVAQLDAHPTADQEVVGLTPTGLATFFHGD